MRTLLGVAAVAVLVAATAAVSRAGDPYQTREQVYGGMEATFGDCPDIEVPPVGAACTETHVIFFRGDLIEGGGAPLSRQRASWRYFIETDHAVFTGAPNPDVTVVRLGFGELPEGSAAVDALKLSSASISADLALQDGTSVAFAGTWTATSDRFTYGNDGPNGNPAIHTRCLTVNVLAHQKVRYAKMSGTLAGQHIEPYLRPDNSTAAIFDNHFRYLELHHQGCG
jgi:hypothetical protein